MELALKVLIYMDINDLKPVGGPRGYLYNLSIGLKKNAGVYFLNSNALNEEDSSKSKKIFKKIIPANLWTKMSLFKYINSIIDSDGCESKVDFSNYDAVHFHSTFDLYKNRNLLKKYNGKIILTSHSPQAPYLELKDLMINSNFPNFLIQKIISKLEKIDIYAFTNCTDIIFPCEDAMEPYFNTFKYFKENYSKLSNKIHFLLTGINRPTNIKKVNISRSKNGFLVCYIGRHNQVKGYDLLLKAAKKISQIDSSVEFIIAGKEYPLHSDKKLKNWHELGWTNNPMGIEAASDLFVLPNRETYFDLALLEAISVPSVVLISKTGGNKYFQKFNSKSINFFEPNNVDDLVDKILSIKNNVNISEAKSQNKEIYENNFTPQIFAKNYIRMVKNIVRKK